MKHKKTFALLLTIICTWLYGPTKAQINQQWGYSLFNPNTDTGHIFTYGIAADQSGNVYNTGVFSGTIDFNPGAAVSSITGGSYEDLYLTKSDSNGNFMWVKTITGTNFTGFSQSMRLDAAGNIYLFGIFGIGTMDVDPGPGVYNLTSGSYNGFILKLDPNGNFLWAKTIPGNSNSIYQDNFVFDSTGNLYLTCGFSSTVDADPGAGIYTLTSNGTTDICLLKLDASGNFIWAKQVGGAGDDEPSALTVDAAGNIYLAGIYEQVVDFDPGPGVVQDTAQSLNDNFIVKLDAAGDFSWVKMMEAGFGSPLLCTQLIVDNTGSLYLGGTFSGPVDFDPDSSSHIVGSSAQAMFVTKWSASGHFLWMTGAETNGTPAELHTDNRGHLYLSGFYNYSAVFNAWDTANAIFMNSNASIITHGYLCKMDTASHFIWIKENPNTSIEHLYDDGSGNFLITGSFFGTADLDFGTGVDSVSAQQYNSALYVVKLTEPDLWGTIYFDADLDCVQDTNETGIPGMLLSIQPGNIIAQSDASGIWYANGLSAGTTYTVTIDTSTGWSSTCSQTQIFVSNLHSSIGSDFGVISNNPCPDPEVTIFAPFFRRCFSGQVIYINAENRNTATGILTNAYMDVTLDPLLLVDNISLPYTSLGNNVYRFQVGDLYPGQNIAFTISTTVSCTALLGQTLFMEARLLPLDSCYLDTIPAIPFPSGPGSVNVCSLPWDHSSLTVSGACSNDTVIFTITNTGTGNMQCYAPVRVYVDGYFAYTDSVLLAAGEDTSFVFNANGQVWVAQADQHPLHPGNSHPMAYAEVCGNMGTSVVPGIVNQFPMDDADPNVDIYCGTVSGAYDPNDKTGFPTGLSTQHEILPGQQLQYLIRFQNTGTDTAFNIVVRDTLDTDLNIFSVVPGIASHACTFRMYGPRVLEWTFANIMLPDSTTNEPGSHGFLTFTVEQNSGLPNGTAFLNDADIYFDFNDPIITNETSHVVDDQQDYSPVGLEQVMKTTPGDIVVFPNPANEYVTVLCTGEGISTYTIVNQLGQRVSSGSFVSRKNTIDLRSLPAGFYLLTVEGAERHSVKLIKH
ncbi:MAG: hypothetical protein K0S33_1967 [Bacteroidetes bacterium]|nr:hypothetical protein [Bacteroidota bacterium]